MSKLNEESLISFFFCVSDILSSCIVFVITTLDPAYSFFQTDLLQRYSSGRFDFVVHQWAHENDNSSTDHHMLRFNKDESLPGPCLAVSRNRNGGSEASYLKLRCKTMVTNDEKCWYRTNYDIRQYYTHPMKEHYLPLGPR